jgi:hypothetical protein
MDPNYIHTEGAGTLLEVNELYIGSCVYCILGSVIYYKTVGVPIKGDMLKNSGRDYHIN